MLAALVVLLLLTYFQFVMVPSQQRIKEFSIVAMNYRFDLESPNVEYVTLEYLGHEVKSPIIRVSKDDIVRLRVVSVDVLHGISIDAYGINKQLPPGKAVTVEFVADIVGEFHVHCSIYCGEGHDFMHMMLIVTA